MSSVHVLSEIRRVYSESIKPSDSMFNLYLARPLAAPIVALLAKTSITPNQVSLGSLVPMLAGCGCLALMEGPLGIWLGVLGVELAYILDCVDGQLARITSQTSIIGGELDFMLDGIKAMCLIVALTVRWATLNDGGQSGFVIGLLSLGFLGVALTLTRFIRSEAYCAATGTKRQDHGESAGAAQQRKGPLWPVEMAARSISQYPVTLPVFAAFDRFDLFVWAYGVVHLLYAGRTGLAVAYRLGGAANSEDRSGE